MTQAQSVAIESSQINSSGVLLTAGGGTGLSTVGTNGQVLTSNGTTLSWVTPTTTSPGGSNTQIQFNSSGSFGGSANLTWDGSNLTNNYPSSGTAEIAMTNSGTTSGSNARVRIKTGVNGGTTLGDAYVQYTDSLNWNWSIGAGSSTSNNLVFTNTFGLGSSEKMRILSSGAVAFGGSTNYGTVGQALISNGSGAAPTWGVSATSYTVTYLIVGGGGGASSGGGGGGGVLNSTTTVYKGTVYPVVVGQGGAGIITVNYANSGGASQFGTITALGGGGGGGDTGIAGNGGSGGGAGCSGGTFSGGTAVSGQGNAGGANGSSVGAGGGGGGAGGAGSAGANGSSGPGGNGGAGLSVTIGGITATYGAGGGGGARPYQNTGNSSGGTGGGGAGTGSQFASSTAYSGRGVDGLPNTGSGGGGGSGYSISGPTFGQGGGGGSGIVILSIPSASYSGVYTGSPVITTSGSNTILQFLQSGSYTA